ncbi:hypothetical protein M569_11209, partial [Genlisea aurea]
GRNRKRREKRDTTQGRGEPGKKSPRTISPPKRKTVILLDFDLPCERTLHGKGRPTQPPPTVKHHLLPPT